MTMKIGKKFEEGQIVYGIFHSSHQIDVIEGVVTKSKLVRATFDGRRSIFGKARVWRTVAVFKNKFDSRQSVTMIRHGESLEFFQTKLEAYEELERLHNNAVQALRTRINWYEDNNQLSLNRLERMRKENNSPTGRLSL